MEKNNLRSNFPKGTLAWAARRAHWRVLGFNDEDLEKPKIAIVNSSSDLAVCFSHLDAIAKKIREFISAAGGISFEVRTAAPSDFITSAACNGGYILSSRDLIPNEIEVAVEGAQLDGMICLASCDKTVPGQLMAAARLNIPTVLVNCGFQPSGEHRGEHNDVEDLMMNVGYYKAGMISLEELTEITETAIQGPGVCPGIGTANTMASVTEALGMGIPGNAPVLANSVSMWQKARQAGERIVQMVWEDLKPRDILTPEAFSNAAMVTVAVGGSINVIKHLQGIAKEGQTGVDVYGLFEKYIEEIPLLLGIRPNGEHLIEDMEEAGGARAVMKQLESRLYLDAPTVTGQTVGEIMKDTVVADEKVIRPLDKPLSSRTTFKLLKGSLTPEYGVLKIASQIECPSKFSGSAVVYEKEEEAIEDVKNKKIKSGDVVVVRGYGIKGSPGHGLFGGLMFALEGAGLADKVAIVSDGSTSGLCNKTLLICEATPEAAEGGPLALVEDGDTITIDLEKREANLEVNGKELERRRKNFVKSEDSGRHGWLHIYHSMVNSLKDGAVLTEKFKK